MQEVSTDTHTNELVNKNETSTVKHNQRTRKCREKINKIIEQHMIEARQKKLYAAALTLCFADADSYGGKYISRFLDALRKKLKTLDVKLKYAWVLEKSNVLHYHLIIWLPYGFMLNHDDLSKWWSVGSTWIQSCDSTKAWGKYISKAKSKADLPKGARVFGYGGLSEDGKIEVQQAVLPQWLKAILPFNERAKKHPVDGWVNIDTGLIYESPFVWTSKGYAYRADR